MDEFNHNTLWKQELIVPARTHQVTVTRYGKVVWSQPVAVPANQRVIINIGSGKMRTTDWPRGAKLPEMPRFKAGTASASVVIAPVSGSISASSHSKNRLQIQPSNVKWASLETVDTDISGMSPVPPNGDRQVSPRQERLPTSLTAAGPGGTVVKSSLTVDS